MMSLPFRVACILIAGFLIVLVVTYIYKLNSRKVFWGVGLTTIIGILILLGLGVLRPSWGTETGTAVIVGISYRMCNNADICSRGLASKEANKGKENRRN